METKGDLEATEAVTLATRAVDVATQAKAIAVKDAASFGRAAEMLKAVKAMAKEITDWVAPLKAKAHAAHVALTQAEKEKLAPLVEAESILKRGMAAYQEEEERRRREEERRLQEEARKRAEEERLAEAIDLEAAGDKAAAEELIAAPVAAPVVVLRPAAKVAGVSFRQQWKAAVTDLRALARGVADGTVPPQAIAPNMTFLDSQARALRDSLAYPGVKAYGEKVVASGRG